MNFDVFGGFEIHRKSNRHGVFDKAFWERVRASEPLLPDACGCYVFAVKNGQNIVAWYVGKTEKNTFQRECFQATKVNYYNDVFASKNGTLLLFLLPRKTGSNRKFSKPTKTGYRDIDFLESMLIGIALERNSSLMNVKKTKMLREMHVPGVINSPIGHPPTRVADLRNALGISGS